MSHIGKKTESILEKGKRTRETWSPKLGGAPLRHYVWWREQTGKYRAQENFCHFWRVVLIWAPLLRLRQLTLDRRLVKGFRRKINGSNVLLAAAALYFTAVFVSGSVAVGRAMWDMFAAWSILLAPLSVVVFVVALAGCLFAIGYFFKAIAWLYQRLAVSRGWTNRSRRPRKPASRREIPLVVRQSRDKVGRFGRSTGEYAVLVAQVVRVKKWKICPLVQIPESISLEK